MPSARHYGYQLEKGECVRLIDLPAPEVAKALGRACRHQGDYNTYTAILHPETIWGAKAVGSIYFGRDRIWATGAHEIAEYCRRVWNEIDNE